eukprot:maker-scaffold1630_size32793-snap-gene-0.6 protein:Tk02395 transcript:maker-scaffold1630_size32793-snap-gene-0.6-mRNA-1 annotation:"predicted protein"
MPKTRRPGAAAKDGLTIARAELVALLMATKVGNYLQKAFKGDINSKNNAYFTDSLLNLQRIQRGKVLDNLTVNQLREFLRVRGIIPNGARLQLLALSRFYFRFPVIRGVSEDHPNDRQPIDKSDIHWREASLKKSTVRRPRISLDNEGNVASTRCDCEAGADGRCCHVAALLFMADDLALGRQPVMQEPCTSKPQMWGKGSSSKQTPQEIYTARYNDKFDANRYITFKPCAIVDKCTSDSLLRAIQDCHHSYSNMWEDLLFYEYQDYELEQNQRLLLMAMTQNFIEGLTRGAASVDHANVLASYVHVPGTVDQSNSEAWHQERQFRIIGSRFMDFAKNPFKCARSLWKKEDISHLPAIRWGMEHESEALNDYQQVFGVEVQK